MERGLPVNVPLNGGQQDEVENYSTDHGQVQTATYHAMIRDAFQDDDRLSTIVHPLRPTHRLQIVL